MLKFFDFARELSLLSITVRLACAVICGGLIGLEREFKRRPAGFRTHILICLGAAMTTLTSQYLYFKLHAYTDIARLGAQMIAGIGFIGAGSIIVTKHKRVKGLTTAAGLWTCAIIGLVCGGVFLELALLATVMVLLAELLLIKIENRFAREINDLTLYIEYQDSNVIVEIVRIIRASLITMNDLQITRVAEGDEKYHYCAVLTARATKTHAQKLVEMITSIDGVLTIEDM